MKHCTLRKAMKGYWEHEVECCNIYLKAAYATFVLPTPYSPNTSSAARPFGGE